MRPNFTDVQFTFYGLKEFQGSSVWPSPVHAGEWLKRHYSYSLAGSVFDKYQLAMSMVAGPRLVDRISFDVLRIENGTATERKSGISHSFHNNTCLQSRFEIELDDLCSDKNAWRFYQSQRNMAYHCYGIGNDRHMDRLLEDAGIIKGILVDAMETALRREHIKIVSESHPSFSSMLIDIFMDYKDAVYDLGREPETHLHLVKTI